MRPASRPWRSSITSSSSTSGRFSIYGHLRRGLTLRRGDEVVAGQQLGWTASEQGRSCGGRERWNAFGATLLPAEPTTDDVLQCRAETSLANEDPDFDLVRYRYRWTVAGRPLRTVTTAALSDVLRRGLVSPWEEIECAITPADGRLSSATARAAGTIRP